MNMKIKNPAVYIMTNKVNGTLYTGVTSNLLQRVSEHKEGLGSSFSARYKCTLLVWYYFFETMTDAIHMEKVLKKYSRSRKLRLIESTNPPWNDLYKDLYHQ